MAKKIAKVDVHYGYHDGGYSEHKTMTIHDEDRTEELIDSGMTLYPLREAMNEAMLNKGKEIKKKA